MHANAAWKRGMAAIALLAGAAMAHADSYVDFFRAVNLDRPELVEALLNKGMDPNSRGEDGQPAVHRALRDDSPLAAMVLIKHPQFEANLRNPAGETALMLAAIRGQVPIIKALMDRGASVQHDGWAPLHYAASQPNYGPLELLVSKGADLNARSPNGSTPLMMAARYGSDDVALWLLKRGADASLRNEKNMTAADFARSVGRDALAAKLTP